jgi:hypothetical protein
MKAPMVGIPFRLYITVEDAVIGAILTQVMEGKEHIITYLSWHLIDAEMRYSFIKKLCLSLFYACSKLRHYLLSSTCIIGRIRKWAYAAAADFKWEDQKVGLCFDRTS